MEESVWGEEWKDSIWIKDGGKCPEVNSGQYYKTLQKSQKDLKRFLDFVRKEP